ncbi:hypothetical protein FSP39_022212 [Pinctada imbricata]|uniref:Uncharacterized protein n=1 Tax=Pinctada imbricata TaxID=66713 RepID=A0AA88XVU9_PINIB|nr:hypothetical protein FSP39_022212 [Pinctada imbricata]
MGAESSTINDLDLENPLRDGHPMWIIQHGQYDEQNLVTVISNDNDDREIRNLFSKYVKVLILLLLSFVKSAPLLTSSVVVVVVVANKSLHFLEYRLSALSASIGLR